MLKDETTCIRCAMCASRCPTHAITMKKFEFYRECVTVPGPQREDPLSAGQSSVRVTLQRREYPVTGIELWVMFTLGLVSSLHCVQMCGPIVLSYSVAAVRGRPSPAAFRPLVAGTCLQRRTHSYLRAARRGGRARRHTVGLVGRLAGITQRAGHCRRRL